MLQTSFLGYLDHSLPTMSQCKIYTANSTGKQQKRTPAKEKGIDYWQWNMKGKQVVLPSDQHMKRRNPQTHEVLRTRISYSLAYSIKKILDKQGSQKKISNLYTKSPAKLNSR